MRVPSGGKSAKPITYLWERHKEIARLMLTGMRPIDICSKLGYTPAWLSTITNSPVFQKYLNSLSERANDQVIDVQKRIQEGAETGVVSLLSILKDQNTQPSLKVKVAQDFLDRSGHGKISKVDLNQNVNVIDHARIEEIKARKQSMLARLDVSDISFQPLKQISV